jgi:anti-anti-sigma factor
MQDFQLLLSEPCERTLELTLIGEVDLATEGPLREATRTAIASGDYHTLVFDLRRLSFMDSTGLHVLTTAQREMVERGGTTTVVCDSANLLKIFELTGLDRVLSVVQTRDEAFAVAA